jgi:hypothetical protein
MPDKIHTPFYLQDWTFQPECRMSVLSIPQCNSNVGTSFINFSHLVIEIHIQQESPFHFTHERAGATRLGLTLLRGGCSTKGLTRAIAVLG